MSLALTYTKSAIQDYRKNLKVRQKALPVLLRKETALRQVIANLKPLIEEKEKQFQKEQKRLERFESVWNDMPSLVEVEKIELEQENIAGTRVKELKSIHFKSLSINPLFEPAWLPAAIEALQKFIELKLHLRYLRVKLDELEQSRKKTTQKVNLYEKVQIPEFEDAILKVKRFLEDKENIATAAKKIAKNRQIKQA